MSFFVQLRNCFPPTRNNFGAAIFPPTSQRSSVRPEIFTNFATSNVEIIRLTRIPLSSQTDIFKERRYHTVSACQSDSLGRIDASLKCSPQGHMTRADLRGYFIGNQPGD